MVDQEDRRAVVADAAEPLREPLALGDVETASGLVEQEQARLPDEGPGDREELALALRQLATATLALVVEPEQRQRAFDHLGRRR